MPEKQEHIETQSPTSERESQNSSPPRRYTLEPLRRKGATSLVCSDVDGIEAIKLKEIRFLWGGLGNEIEIRRSDDLFASLRGRGRTLPSKPAIIRASFGVKLKGASTLRTLVIRPNGSLEVTRDEDRPLLERWLEARGFVEGEVGDDETAVASLVRG